MAVKGPYQLNSQRIIQILADPVFYRSCVAFLFMEEAARLRYIQFEAEVARESSKPCRGCDDKSKATIDPAIADFVRHVNKLQQAGDDTLDPLRDYLCQKLGYRPAKFILYYREKGQPRRLTF